MDLLANLLATGLMLAQAPVPPEKPGAFTPAFFITMIIIFVAFYLLITGPSRRQQETAAKAVEGMKKGDKVITAGGIHGTVARVHEDTVHVVVAKDVEMVFSKASVTVQKPKEVKDEKPKDDKAKDKK